MKSNKYTLVTGTFVCTAAVLLLNYLKQRHSTLCIIPVALFFSPPKIKTATKIQKETLKNGHHRHPTWPLSFSNRRTVVSTPGQGPNVWSTYERGRFDRLAPNEFFSAFVPFSCRWPNCIPNKERATKTAKNDTKEQVSEV